MTGRRARDHARRSLHRLLRLWRYSVRLQVAHRRRTALGASALIVGVASVMVMAAVSAGAERRVLERVRAMGTNLLVIQPAVAPPVAGRVRQQRTVTTLRPTDADLLAGESPLATAVAPAVIRQVVARWEGRNAPTSLLGTTAEGLRIQGIAVVTGRAFDEPEEREQRRVALVGATVARNLFGDTDPVGLTIQLDRVPVEIIGVMRRRGTDVGGADLDNTVVVPLQTAMRRLLNVPFIDALFLQARRVSDLDALEQNAIDILRGRLGTRSGVPVEFDVRNQSVLLRTQRGTSEAFRRLMIATAVFSLVAGAVSIMAVMMLSVRERVPEIALRRAVGARIRDVQWQFVIESALLATSGGMIGVVGGVGVAAIGAVVGQWEVAIPWQAIVAGLTFPIITGLVVGVVPAVRAARLDPGVGLRLHA